ncbi:MAG: hypothetical protein V4642_02150 [Bacteroidota bacterium]
MMNSAPKVLVLGGNIGRWKAAERLHEKDVTNGVESWVYAFSADYIRGAEVTLEEINQYDIVIANANSDKQTRENLQKFSAERASTVRWVTLIEGSGSDYITPHIDFRQIFDNSDLINCINIHSLDLLRLMTKTRVEYIGIPYPVDGISQFTIPFEKRRRESYITPFLLKRWNDYFVARELGIPYYGFEKTIRRTLKTVATDFLKHHETDFDKKRELKKAAKLYNDPSLQILPSSGLKEFFLRNAGAFLWLNLDDRYTWGRFVIDAAALKIPIITTVSTGHAAGLYPETTLENEFQLDKAIEIGKRLINDEEFYRHVANYPEGRMEHLKPEAMVKRLLECL